MTPFDDPDARARVSLSMLHDRILRYCRLAITLLILVLVWTVLWRHTALAQESLSASPALPGAIPSPPQTSTGLPSVWYLLAAGLALLVPAGFVLLAVAGLEPSRAWNTALGGLAAAGLGAFAYWAVGFALQFGGVGLVYANPELRGMVWEWSPLSSEWGIGWGMAGLTGWFLSGSTVTGLAYTLFMAHLPWVLLAASLPVLALRGRAPSTVTLILSLALGGIIYPLAGNWVQGGGWLNALGRNLELGHGFVDFGGAGTVHLVAAGFGLAALAVWSLRRTARGEDALPPAHQPLLAVVGAFLILGGGIGWQFANPLQVETIGTIGMMRGAVGSVLAAAGGLIFPLLYTWFVTGSSEPTLTARGFAAGVVAGLGVGPFVQPGIAFITGLIAGATVPFVTYLLDGRLRLQDRTGLIASSGVPALVGLLFVGIFADGIAGSGWQATGAANFLGVANQGVSGLMVESGFVADFPGQIQAQLIGVAALGLWGFLSGLVLCVPLGLLFHSLLHRQEAPAHTSAPAAAPASYPAEPALFPAAPAAPTQTAVAPYSAPLGETGPLPAYRDPFAAPAARPEFRPAQPPAEQAPHQPAAFVPREGYWPEATPPAQPALPPAQPALPPAQPAPPSARHAADASLPHDPYQSLEPATSPSTAALLDSAIEPAGDTPQDGTPRHAATPGQSEGDTTTDSPVAVPMATQPFIGGSPLMRRRKPPLPGGEQR